MLKNVGHEETAKKFLKETFASNVDLMDQLAKDINLVSTLKAASGAENYQQGSGVLRRTADFPGFYEMDRSGAVRELW